MGGRFAWAGSAVGGVAVGCGLLLNVSEVPRTLSLPSEQKLLNFSSLWLVDFFPQRDDNF